MRLFKGRASPRALLAAAAMTFVVSLLISSQDDGHATPVVAPANARAAAADPAADLDLRRLARAKPAEIASDPFEPRERQSPTATVALAEPVTPPAPPTAPPLPFAYLGQYIDGDTTSIFVAHGEEHYSLEKGAILEGRYRVENIGATEVTFVYLPLGTRQKLAIPTLK
jgi:hypothetical protein